MDRGKRVVLTGGPCSGKTTVLEAFGELGYVTVREAATAMRSLCAGICGIRRQELIMLEQLRAEEEVNGVCSLVFLDRGIIDVATYTEFYVGCSHPEFRRYSPHARYDAVFLLDLVPTRELANRCEGHERHAEELGERLLMAYQQWGYSPIRVPVMAVPARCEFILSKVRGQIMTGCSHEYG
jgi:predicted ATPase